MAMTELDGPPMTRPKNSGQNDAAMMRDLCATLNNPLISGAVVPPEEKAAMDALLTAGKAIPESPVTQPEVPSRGLAFLVAKSGDDSPPISSRTPLTKVFLTGRAGGPEEIASQASALRISMR